jgi:LysR family hca operon transcriptional activator
MAGFCKLARGLQTPNLATSREKSPIVSGEYLIRPEHEVHNVVHAISMITSTRAVMLLPAYTKGYLPESITTRPVQGEVPTLDLVLAYHKANKSPILKLLLSRVSKFAGAS